MSTNTTTLKTITATAPTATYTIGDSLAAYAAMWAVSFGIGVVIGLLGGFTFPKFGPIGGWRINPVIKGVVLPPLIFMIILGCVARNCFGPDLMAPYPNLWSSWVRSICLSILLVRGGLQVKFSGQGLLVPLMAIVPSLVEACFIGLIAKPLFDMPYEFTFAMGFIVAAVSPSVVVPSLISLNDRGYGRKNGLCTSLIASGTFDDIICIIVFGICKTIGYTNYGMGGNTIGTAIGILIA
jgi:hypothetical protein